MKTKLRFSFFILCEIIINLRTFALVILLIERDDQYRIALFKLIQV